MSKADPGRRPTESLFYAPVVYLIGRLTNFKPYVGVDFTLVRDDALRLAGLTLIEEENGSGERVAVAVTDGHQTWPLQSTSSKKRDGLYRTVSFGWYHQTRKYREGEKVMCAKPALAELGRVRRDLYDLLGITDEEQEALESPKAPAKEKQAVRAKMQAAKNLLVEDDHDFCVAMEEEIRELDAQSKGMWALTQLGVKWAKELRAEYEGKIVLSAGPNKTAQYLGEHFDKLYGRATLHLRRKMPRSEEFDKIDDHVMNWLDRVIQRDGLRKRIEDKKPIPPSQVCAWARRGAYTDIRNEGREPVARVFHGALTPKEVNERNAENWTEVVIPRTINESEVLAHHQYASHSEDDTLETDYIEQVMDASPEAAVEDAVAGQEALAVCLDRLSVIIHEEISEEHDPDWHEQLVRDRYVKEMSIREIAKAHGLSFHRDEKRIKAALNRVRDVMLRAREDGELDEFIPRC